MIAWGEDNPYGHPTVQTLNALQQHGLPYVRLRYTYGQGALKPLTRGLIHVSVKGGTLLGLGNGCPYFAAFLVITVGANALYGIYQPWLYSTLGEAIGGLIAAFLQCCIAFWVFFPIMKLIFPSQKKA